jgi:hypothetical protein
VRREVYGTEELLLRYFTWTPRNNTVLTLLFLFYVYSGFGTILDFQNIHLQETTHAYSEQMCVAVTLWICTQEVADSNLGRDAGHPDYGF